MRKTIVLICLCLTGRLFAQQPSKFNGIDANLGNIFRLSDAKTRSISPENFNGAKGAGGKARRVRDRALRGSWGRDGR